MSVKLNQKKGLLNGILGNYSGTIGNVKISKNGNISIVVHKIKKRR